MWDLKLVSVGSERRVVSVYVATAADKTEPMRLSPREAVKLARQLLSAVEAYMPEQD